ncbi:hypothetical protein C1H46_035546 [Malus baccata]|uniref:Uncharacterized protein n=1 Tax=Malus baccata TaxID=106549 RepID=A0A540KXE6_MALBA|nr:hypothetical protein C1H46_035546 [Malus baccata]
MHCLNRGDLELTWPLKSGSSYNLRRPQTHSSPINLRPHTHHHRLNLFQPIQILHTVLLLHELHRHNPSTLLYRLLVSSAFSSLSAPSLEFNRPISFSISSISASTFPSSRTLSYLSSTSSRVFFFATAEKGSRLVFVSSGLKGTEDLTQTRVFRITGLIFSLLQPDLNYSKEQFSEMGWSISDQEAFTTEEPPSESSLSKAALFLT